LLSVSLFKVDVVAFWTEFACDNGLNDTLVYFLGTSKGLLNYSSEPPKVGIPLFIPEYFYYCFISEAFFLKSWSKSLRSDSSY